MALSIKTCSWSEEPCDNLCEGSTDYCSSHNRRIRKIASDGLLFQQKKTEAINSAKEKAKLPRPGIKKVSEKRKELNKEYKPLREKYLIEHPECEIRLMGCLKVSTQIHHTASGWNKATNLNNVSTWKASCDFCNQRLHDVLSAEEARELGLKI